MVRVGGFLVIVSADLDGFISALSFADFKMKASPSQERRFYCSVLESEGRGQFFVLALACTREKLGQPKSELCGVKRRLDSLSVG